MRTLDKERWRVVSPLLDELFELDADGCAQRLAEIRRDDRELADLLAQMLDERSKIESEAFLEGQAADVAHLEMPEVPSLAGTQLGGYTIERPLGQGGMGTVWLARRSDGRFEGQAAIKFLNLALLARGGAERFRREGNLLARLAHPHIARLLDAGVTGGGQPYLVLEYVDGEPIDRWCRDQALSVRDRLRLFLDVLSAVSHAHSNLILHRDLKPTNILVTQAGQVKLLDFGIGKLLETQQATKPTELTHLSGRAFTPDYTSPEQVLGTEVTTAADVYSLGIVLFELLTGKRPYKLKRASMAAVEEAVTEQDAPLASSVAERADVRRHLQGDLDAILAQALRKNPAERYATVAELTADIERHLGGLPVHAQPDRLGYRLAKFIRRNAYAVGAASLVAIAVLGGSGVAVWQAREATRQRDHALALAMRNTAVVDFVRTMLVEAAPADEPIRVSELLNRSVSMLTAGGDEPEHQAAVLAMIGRYFASGPSQPQKAYDVLQRALELTANTRDGGLRAGLLCDTAYVAYRLGRTEEARKMIDEGLSLMGDDHVAAVSCLHQRAQMSRVSNDPDGVLKYGQLAYERLRIARLGRVTEEVTLLDTIAAAHMQSGRIGEAKRHSAMAIARLAETGRADGPDTAALWANQAVYSAAAGDHRQALIDYDGAMRVATRFSPGNLPPAYLVSNRAKSLRDIGRYAEAVPEFDRAADLARKSNDVTMLIDALVHRASSYIDMDDLDAAERSMTAAREPQMKLAPASPTALSIISIQARIDAARGRHVEALAGHTEVIDALDRRRAKTNAIASSLRFRSETHLRQGNFAAAEADARRSLEVARLLQKDASGSVLPGLALLQLALIHRARGETTEAQKLAGEAAAQLVAAAGDEHPQAKRAKAMAS